VCYMPAKIFETRNGHHRLPLNGLPLNAVETSENRLLRGERKMAQGRKKRRKWADTAVYEPAISAVEER
jgi:hypothetical protein